MKSVTAAVLAVVILASCSSGEPAALSQEAAVGDATPRIADRALMLTTGVRGPETEVLGFTDEFLVVRQGAPSSGGSSGSPTGCALFVWTVEDGRPVEIPFSELGLIPADEVANGDSSQEGSEIGVYSSPLCGVRFADPSLVFTRPIESSSEFQRSGEAEAVEQELVIYNIKDAETVATKPIDPPPGSTIASPIAQKTSLFAGDGRVVSIRSYSTREARKVQVGLIEMDSLPVEGQLTEAEAFINTANTMMIAFDPATGEIAWENEVTCEACSEPTLSLLQGEIEVRHGKQSSTGVYEERIPSGQRVREGSGDFYDVFDVTLKVDYSDYGPDVTYVSLASGEQASQSTEQVVGQQRCVVSNGVDTVFRAGTSLVSRSAERPESLSDTSYNPYFANDDPYNLYRVDGDGPSLVFSDLDAAFSGLAPEAQFSQSDGGCVGASDSVYAQTNSFLVLETGDAVATRDSEIVGVSGDTIWTVSRDGLKQIRADDLSTIWETNLIMLSNDATSISRTGRILFDNGDGYYYIVDVEGG